MVGAALGFLTGGLAQIPPRRLAQAAVGTMMAQPAAGGDAGVVSFQAFSFWWVSMPVCLLRSLGGCLYNV